MADTMAISNPDTETSPGNLWRRLPLEIRREIYSYLLLAESTTEAVTYAAPEADTEEVHEWYLNPQFTTGLFTVDRQTSREALNFFNEACFVPVSLSEEDVDWVGFPRRTPTSFIPMKPLISTDSWIVEREENSRYRYPVRLEGRSNSSGEVFRSYMISLRRLPDLIKHIQLLPSLDSPVTLELVFKCSLSYFNSERPWITQYLLKNIEALRSVIPLETISFVVSGSLQDDIRKSLHSALASPVDQGDSYQKKLRGAVHLIARAVKLLKQGSPHEALGIADMAWMIVRTYWRSCSLLWPSNVPDIRIDSFLIIAVCYVRLSEYTLASYLLDRGLDCIYPIKGPAMEGWQIWDMIDTFKLHEDMIEEVLYALQKVFPQYLHLDNLSQMGLAGPVDGDVMFKAIDVRLMTIKVDGLRKFRDIMEGKA